MREELKRAVDIGCKGVRAVEGRGAFVALDLVFLEGRDVVGVGVRWAAEDDDGRGVLVCEFGEEALRFLVDGFLPAATGHGRCFAWGDDYEHLADAE